MTQYPRILALTSSLFAVALLMDCYGSSESDGCLGSECNGDADSDGDGDGDGDGETECDGSDSEPLWCPCEGGETHVACEGNRLVGCAYTVDVDEYVAVYDQDCGETVDGGVCGVGPDGRTACLVSTGGTCLEPDDFTTDWDHHLENSWPSDTWSPLMFCANGEACIVNDDTGTGSCIETGETCSGEQAEWREATCHGELSLIFCRERQPLFLDCESIGATCIDGFGCIVQAGGACIPGMSRCDVGLDDPVDCPDGLNAGVCPDEG